MKPATISAAADQRWDVVLVGSSFAAVFFALALRGSGLSVLFVERGSLVDRATQIERRNSDRPVILRQRNLSPYQKDWAIRHQFGGCSNCWWGNTPRFHPSDFSLKSRYGVGSDWPMDYGTLEPYLTRVEALMEVAGGGSQTILPRSAPYPYPPHVPTRAERRLMAHDPSWVPMPTARSNGGRRASCCASGVCSLCPIDAKFTILNSLDQFQDENFSFLTDTQCRLVETEGGRASAVIVRGSDARETSIKADFIGLAANPVGNAEILLRSGLGGDRVGRGVHEQAGQFVWADIPFDNYYGGTSITGLGYGFYDGDFRREAASVLIESWNAPPSLRLERGKWLQRLKLKLVAEDLPRDDNRVILEDDAPLMIWHGHSDYAYAGLARARENISDLLPFDHSISFGGFEPTEAHLIGGTPMGSGPGVAVVDAECRLFDVQNLACLGASSFPTGAAANPTLTLSALSLYLGERLV